jgi:hypothetical protein
MPAGIAHPAGSRTGPRQLARYREAYAPRDLDPRCHCCGCATHRWVEVGRGKAMVWRPECAVCADAVDWGAR